MHLDPEVTTIQQQEFILYTFLCLLVRKQVRSKNKLIRCFFLTINKTCFHIYIHIHTYIYIEREGGRENVSLMIWSFKLLKKVFLFIIMKKRLWVI